MNAQLILAAVAALCCVQGIAGRSMQARPLPWYQSVEDHVSSEVADVDQSVEEVVTMAKDLLKAISNELNLDLEGLDIDVHALKENKATRNIFTCGTSLLNAFRTAKSVLALVNEWKQLKATLKADEELCNAASKSSTPIPVEACLERVNSAYKAGMADIKAQIAPMGIKIATSIFALKSCFSLV